MNAAYSASRLSFSIPGSNVASSGPVLDGRHIVYGFAVPRFHHPVCVSCGQQPFTNFRVHIYLRSYRSRSTSITLSQPRALFTAPRGAQVILYSLSRNWLVYDTDSPFDRWQLFARNVLTGRVVLLDSPSREETPSRFLHADTDGRTVVWQSWTAQRGQIVSVIRAYDLAAGRRALLYKGGTGRDYFYGYPAIAGNRVVLVKEPGNRPNSRIVLEGLTRHHLRTLTPTGEENDEPSISGSILAWVHGSLTVGHAHGLVVANLSTGRRVALRHSSAQLPRVVAGRYVVFAPDYPTTSPKGYVQVYDALTGQRRTIAAGPDASGFVPNWTVEAGGSSALVRMDKPCGASNGVCPAHYELISL